VKLAKDLNEFKDFCHYAGLSDWDVHKQVILQNIDKYGFYIFDGNDAWYYVVQHPEWWYGIFQHPMWLPDEDGEETDVTVTLE
jgi:hypothetical protein